MQSSHDEYAKRGTQPIGFNPTDLFYVVMIAVVCWMTYQAWGWTDGARQGPLAIGFVSLGLLLLGLVGQISNRAVAFADGAEGDELETEIHMDSATDYGALPPSQVAKRGLIFFGYLLFFMVSVALVGFILTIPIFVFVFLKVEGGASWKVSLVQSALILAIVIGVFDRALNIPWPSTVLGGWFPALTAIPGV